MSETIFVDGDSLAYPTEGEVGWASPGSLFPVLVQRALTKLGLGQTVNPKAVIDIQSTTKGVLFPRMSTVERDAIATPPNGLLIFNTTDQQFQYYDTVEVAWTPIGTGTGGAADPNYILFPVAIEDPLTTPDYPWRLYNDSAAVPVDGTGGTAAISLVRNTTLPLNPLGDFEVAKAGVSALGSGFSTDFTIDRRHLGRVLQITFDSMLKGGTYTPEAIRVYIIQDPNGTPVVIEPVNTTLQLGVATTKVKHIASFQTAINVTSYRLCIHVYGSDTSSWTISYTNFKVWEPEQNYGAIITDWTNYTPTILGFTSVSNNNFRSRRVGSSLEIEGYFTGATPTASEFRIPLPGGLTVNTNQTIMLCGQMATSITTSFFFKGYSLVTQNGLSYVNYGIIENYPGSATGLFMGNWGSSYLTGTYNYSVKISVPITGWGSSMALSSDAGDGRVVACRVRGACTASGTDPFIFPTVLYDTHGAYSTVTGKYTIPVSGYYRCTANVEYASSTNRSMFVRSDSESNADDNTIGITNTRDGSNSNLIGTNTRFYRTGELIALRSSSGFTTNAGSYFEIERVNSGSQIIAPVETVVATATKESGSWTDGVKVTWTHEQIDTHGALNIATGDYTCPMSGKYLVTAMLRPNSFMTGSGSTTEGGVDIRKNGTREARTSFYWNGSGSILSAGEQGTRIIDCVAGDVLSIFGVGTFTVESGKFSHLSIMRIGI